MNDKAHSRPDAYAELLRLVQSLFLQGWQSVFESGRRPPDGAQSVDLEALLGRLTEQVDAAFAALDAQLSGIHILHEAILEAATAFNRLQGTAEGMARQHTAWLAALPAVPKLGMLQGRQARLETLAAHILELRAAQGELASLVRQSVDDGISRFRRRLDGQASPMGLRELYDHWLVSGERAYEHMLESETFSLALARLANASMSLDLELQQALDGLLEYLGLPTRRELAGTQRRLQELRRRQRRSEREIPKELAALRQEMAELREELRRLREPERPAGKRPGRAH